MDRCCWLRNSVSASAIIVTRTAQADPARVRRAAPVSVAQSTRDYGVVARIGPGRTVPAAPPRRYCRFQLSGLACANNVEGRIACRRPNSPRSPRPRVGSADLLHDHAGKAQYGRGAIHVLFHPQHAAGGFEVGRRIETYALATSEMSASSAYAAAGPAEIATPWPSGTARRRRRSDNLRRGCVRIDFGGSAVTLAERDREFASSTGPSRLAGVLTGRDHPGGRSGGAAEVLDLACEEPPVLACRLQCAVAIGFQAETEGGRRIIVACLRAISGAPAVGVRDCRTAGDMSSCTRGRLRHAGSPGREQHSCAPAVKLSCRRKRLWRFRQLLRKASPAGRTACNGCVASAVSTRQSSRCSTSVHSPLRNGLRIAKCAIRSGE